MFVNADSFFCSLQDIASVKMNHRINDDYPCVTYQQDSVSYDAFLTYETANIGLIGLIDQVVKLEAEENCIDNKHYRSQVSHDYCFLHLKRLVSLKYAQVLFIRLAPLQPMAVISGNQKCEDRHQSQ